METATQLESTNSVKLDSLVGVSESTDRKIRIKLARCGSVNFRLGLNLNLRTLFKMDSLVRDRRIYGPRSAAHSKLWKRMQGLLRLYGIEEEEVKNFIITLIYINLLVTYIMRSL